MAYDGITRFLKPEYQRLGFTLEEDEDFVTLKHHGVKVGTFNAYASTLTCIEAHAKRYLNDNIVEIAAR